MGGSGSGGWNFKGRPTIDRCAKLTISSFKRSNATKKGTEGIIKWGKNSIGFETIYDDMFVLKWKTANDPKVREQFLGFQWLAHKRHIGGHQYYLVCPKCHKLRTAVYFLEDFFACRSCHKLPYASQRETNIWRFRRRLENISQVLGSNFEWGAPEPQFKPKYMHNSTYTKLSDEFINVAIKYYQSCLKIMKFPRKRTNRLLSK